MMEKSKECLNCGRTLTDMWRDDFEREVCEKCIDLELEGEYITDIHNLEEELEEEANSNYYKECM